MSLPTPNYVTTREFDVYIPSTKANKILPAGSFVRPIDPTYLPEHIKTNGFYNHVNHQTEVYCYTRHGIALIDWKDIRRV